MDSFEKNRPPPYNDFNSSTQSTNNDPYQNQQNFYPNVTNQPTPIFVPVSQPAPATTTSTTVVLNSGGVVGGCPVCHNKNWTGTYSCCAWLLCLFCFPCGLICCCCMRKKKCTKCGYTVG